MKYLLGATKNHEIVFGEFGVKTYSSERRVTSVITTRRCYSSPVWKR